MLVPPGYGPDGEISGRVVWGVKTRRSLSSGRALRGPVGAFAHECLLPAILLWMHNGLGYIYNSFGFNGLMPARGLRLKRTRI